MKILTLRNSEIDNQYAITAVQSRADEKDWYVLKYDVVSTEYNNTIVFKTLGQAYKEFMETESSYPEERIELIFAPEAGDPDFDENIVVNYKLYKGGERLTSLEQLLIDWANDNIDNLCTWDGPRAVIKELLEYGFTKEDLEKLSFNKKAIDEILKELTKED